MAVTPIKQSCDGVVIFVPESRLSVLADAFRWSVNALRGLPLAHRISSLGAHYHDRIDDIRRFTGLTATSTSLQLNLTGVGDLHSPLSSRHCRRI